MNTEGTAFLIFWMICCLGIMTIIIIFINNFVRSSNLGRVSRFADSIENEHQHQGKWHRLCRLIRLIDGAALITLFILLFRADVDFIFSVLLIFSPYLLVKSLLYVFKGINFLPWKY